MKYEQLFIPSVVEMLRYNNIIDPDINDFI